MFEPDYTSALLQQAVEALSRLPGIGKKTALRIALHLLRSPESETLYLSDSLARFRKEVVFCKECFMISDVPLCPFCSNAKRDHSLICVVENVRDVMNIENTGCYNGLYHVLGGIISPIDGIGPSDLTLAALRERLQKGGVSEIILALSTTMEGETTGYYLYKYLKDLNVLISAIARGVAFGNELEYADQLTLGRAIENRQVFNP